MKITMYNAFCRMAKKIALRMAAINIICAVLIAGIVAAAGLLAANVYVVSSTKDNIVTGTAAYSFGGDCILVLGAGVSDDGYPRLLLRDRLDTGIDLYLRGASDRLLMSGDHGRIAYDEVNTMKKYAADAGIVTDDIFMDHAGFSTYESLYRARDIFGARRVIIVSQRYHLYRALYIARGLGLEAIGVPCDPGRYHGMMWLEGREMLARCKDIFFVAAKPEPTYLGEPIPISGSGNATNDFASREYVLTGCDYHE